MFQVLFERSADAIWLFDPEALVFVDCNEAAVRLMRARDKAQLLGARPGDLSPPCQPDGQDSASKAAALTGLLGSEGTQRFEWMGRRFDGTDVPLEVMATPLVAGGRKLHVMVSRDVTERKRAEEALRESEQKFRQLFEASSDAIQILDPETRRFIDCNEASVRITGGGNKDWLLSQPVESLAPERQPDGRLSRDAARDWVARALAEGTQRFEWLGRRYNGEALPLEVLLTPMRMGERLVLVTASRDISARKKDEQKILELNQTLERRISERTAELTASEARLRTLLDHAPEAIVVFSGDTGRFVSCNENAIRLYGLSRDELLTLTPSQVSPERQPDGRPSQVVAAQKIQEALTGATPVFEWTHRHADGRLISCEVRLVRLPGEGPPLIRASILDNTERKRRERIQQATFEISEAVHTAEDLESLYRQIHTIIRALMPAQNFYIALLEPGTEMISFAYHVDERTPKPPPQPMTTGLTSLVLRLGRALLVTRTMEARRQPSGGEITLEGLDGATYVECGVPAAVWLGVPLVLQGKTVGAVAVQDYQNERAYGEEEKQILTFVAGQIALAIERKRAEQALRESEEKFRALFEASSQGVILHDEERMLEVNPACLRILGFRGPEEMVGKHPAETSAPIQPNGERADVLARQHIAECMARGSARFEWLARNSRGVEVPIEIVLTRVQWGGRQLIQAVFNDISERKQAEAELLKTLAREKELGELRSNFVSMVSHEFRTPLSIIQSSAEILGDYLDRLAPEERREQLESIVQNTRRMAEMMDEILVLSRLDAGRMDFQPAPVDLAAFCRRVVEEVLSATERRCPVDLTLAPIPTEARADERLLGHIFTNLLSNAIKYSEAGARVEFRVEREDGEAVCRIRDRGIGIPASDQPWLFNAFHRGGNVGDRPGTGLGLVLVKRCTELHGGRVRIDSTVGEGTAVTVRLPLFRTQS